VVTDAGFAALGDVHLSQNYAWKFNTPYADDAEQDARSQAFMDSLEDILKQEAQDVLQAKADAVWDEAQTLAATLEPQFKAAAETIERKVTDASAKAVEKAVQSLSREETFSLLLEKSGMDEDVLIEKIAELIRVHS
jgi:Skp family chaperone for outer membrane proteins